MSNQEYDLLLLQLLELDVGYSCETEMERWQVIDGIKAKGGDYVGD